MGRSGKYFVSYAAADADRVRPLLNVFRTRGYDLWDAPSEVTAAGSFGTRIGDALQAVSTPPEI